MKWTTPFDMWFPSRDRGVFGVKFICPLSLILQDTDLSVNAVINVSLIKVGCWVSLPVLTQRGS